MLVLSPHRTTGRRERHDAHTGRPLVTKWKTAAYRVAQRWCEERKIKEATVRQERRDGRMRHEHGCLI